MEEIYKLSLENEEYWDYNDKNKKFERTKKPCHIFVKKSEPFLNDKMICNYQDASGKKYLWSTLPLGTRLREHEDFVIIEPSGIMVPKNNFKLVESSKEISKNRGIDISSLSCTSYFCNLMSDSIRGGIDEISNIDVEKYRNFLFNQPSKPYNPSFLTPFEFAYLFVKACNNKGIESFDSDLLLMNIISKSTNPEYLPLVWNINYTIGEHYNSSESLFNAFSLLRYIGLIYPDYDDECAYGTINIDSNIEEFPEIVCGKESYQPIMEQYVDEMFDLSNKKDSHLTKKKSIKNLLKRNDK